MVHFCLREEMLFFFCQVDCLYICFHQSKIHFVYHQAFQHQDLRFSTFFNQYVLSSLVVNPYVQIVRKTFRMSTAFLFFNVFKIFFLWVYVLSRGEEGGEDQWCISDGSASKNNKKSCKKTWPGKEIISDFTRSFIRALKLSRFSGNS